MCFCVCAAERESKPGQVAAVALPLCLCEENVGQPLVLPPSAISIYLFLCLSLFPRYAAVAAVVTATADIVAAASLPYLQRLVSLSFSLSVSAHLEDLQRGM